MRYVVTGGTGFIGRRVVARLLSRRDDTEVWAHVDASSTPRFGRLAQDWGPRVHALPDGAEAPAAKHVVNCRLADTRLAIELAGALGATLHQLSSSPWQVTSPANSPKTISTSASS